MKTVLYKTDRATYSWTKKINPFWWFGNDEAKPTDTFVYLYVRNAMFNFRSFVVGNADRDHYVTGIVGPDPLLNIRSDIGERGWCVALVWCWLIPLPWVSYASEKVEWYAGWMPWGQLNVKWNKLNSSIQIL